MSKKWAIVLKYSFLLRSCPLGTAGTGQSCRHVGSAFSSMKNNTGISFLALKLNKWMRSNSGCGSKGEKKIRIRNTGLLSGQGCGSAFIFCGSGSIVFFNADPDPSFFSMRIRIQMLSQFGSGSSLKHFVKLTLWRACCSWSGSTAFCLAVVREDI